mmetsp:Transcript_3378/g.8532  ORF Transcript_3378/g.8532 Transcript_3378/m.8532 type:complete len:201 (+) Transcript_3378:642-1244(+)
MAVAQAQGSTETAAAAAKAEAEAAAEELRRHVEAYVSLQADAVSCQEDEILYGRAGWLLGACMLNHHLGRGTVPEDITLPVLRALLASGRSLAARMPSGSPPLFFTWHNRPYLGAAHGLMGICYVLLHYWDAGMAVPHLHSDVEATIRCAPSGFRVCRAMRWCKHSRWRILSETTRGANDALPRQDTPPLQPHVSYQGRS